MIDSNLESASSPAESLSGRAAASGWFRINLWLHRWASLIATPFFLVLCVTGTILIFHHEIEKLFGILPEAQVVAGTEPAPLAPMVEIASAKMPERKPMYVFFDEDAPERVAIGMGPLEDVKFDRVHPAFFNAFSGAFLQAVDPNKTFTGFILRLHANWFLDLPGQLFGGVIALLVLISVLSGLVVYAPYVKRIAFGMVRRGRGPRLVQLDLHNLIGVVVFGWLFVVSVTGIFLALASIAIQVWTNTELKEMAAKSRGLAVPSELARIAIIDDIIKAAREELPDRRLRFIAFPGTELSGKRHYMALLNGTKGYDNKLFEIVVIEAATGLVSDSRPAPWYLKVILLSEPLHFGDYGGLPLKLLWLACSFLTLFIVGNGAWLWWSRRAPQRRTDTRAEART